MPTPREVEVAAEHCLRERFGCVVCVRAMKTQWQRQDLFASDVVGIQCYGSKVFAQATKGDRANVAHRRRKLERIPWHSSDTVLILEFREERKGRSMVYEFRVHEYVLSASGRRWNVRSHRIPVPRAWFKAWKPVEAVA